MPAIREPMTIVVPVKDRATLVLHTLAGIKAQTWRPLKVVVVDNGSTDGTFEYVREWIEKNPSEGMEVELLREAKPGPSAARNRGLEAVDTRLMMFFDSDDQMQPGHVESIMRRFHEDDQPDLVCFRVKYHPINGEDRITHGPGADMMTAHLVHSLMRTQGFACETALVRRAGGWNENLRCWEDLELGARLISEARKRAFIRDVNVDVFARADSVTGTEFSSRRGEWETALDVIEADFQKSRHKDREKWRRILAYRKAILAATYKKEGNRDYALPLLAKALGEVPLSFLQRLYVKAAYHYTSWGGRGAALPLNLIL